MYMCVLLYYWANKMMMMTMTIVIGEFDFTVDDLTSRRVDLACRRDVCTQSSSTRLSTGQLVPDAPSLRPIVVTLLSAVTSLQVWLGSPRNSVCDSRRRGGGIPFLPLTLKWKTCSRIDKQMPASSRLLLPVL